MTKEKKLNEEELLSVLMPVYNTKEEWLRLAIESVLDQTYKKIKLLLLDDGSNNETKNILKEYEKKDFRVRVITNDVNRGLIWTLNNAISLVETRYFARMDSDDFSVRERFKKQMDYLRSHPEIDVLGSNGYILGTRKLVTRKKWFLETDSQVKAGLWRYCRILHPSVILKTETIKKEGGYPNIKYAEDYAFWMKMVLSGDVIFHQLPEPLIEYRIVEGRSEYKRIQLENDFRVKRKFFLQIGMDAPRFDLFNKKIFEINGILNGEEAREVFRYLDRLEIKMKENIRGISNKQLSREMQSMKRKILKKVPNLKDKIILIILNEIGLI